MNSLSWHDRSVESVDDSESPKRSILDISGYSMKVRQNADAQREGQTMFEFLKRRKRFAIERQISKSRNNSLIRFDAPTDRSNTFNQTIDYQGISKISKQKMSLIVDSKEDKYSTISSKKVTFRDNETSLAAPPPTAGRSFFEIVSPFKRRASKLESYTPQETGKQNLSVNATNSAKKLKGKEMTLQKKSLLTGLDQFSSKVNKYCKNVHEFKNKSQWLLAEALSLLSQTEETSRDKLFRRKLEQIRRENKAVERMFSNFESLDLREDIESLTRNLTQNLNSMQSQLKKQYEAEVDSQLKSREAQYKDIIADLEAKLRRSEKSTQSLENKLSELNREQDELFTQTTKKQHQSSRRNQQKNQNMQNQIQQLRKDNQKMLKELQNSSSDLKELDRQNRSLLAQKNSLLRSFNVEKEQIACRKESYLMEEMIKLKKQFQIDMDQLADLYRLKEVQRLQKYNNQQFVIQDLERKISGYIKAQTIFQEEIAALKGHIDKYRVQNDQLLKQMHRITDEACLYWTALKDLKTLSTRLGTFSKYVRIYEDINFRDSTFR